MQKDSETSVIPYTNPQLLLDYWSINTHDGKKRKKDNKTYMYRQCICTLLCYHIGPVYKVSSLDDYSNFFMCCRPATCRYSGFNPSDCMELTQTYHRIIIQSHLPHVREGFSLFRPTFRGRIPVCPPQKRFLTPSGVSLHFGKPRPFCITKPNNDFLRRPDIINAVTLGQWSCNTHSSSEPQSLFCERFFMHLSIHVMLLK